jgi:hypothetical protein
MAAWPHGSGILLYTKINCVNGLQPGQSMEEIIALLVKIEGMYAERVGIACIPESEWSGGAWKAEDKWIVLR